MSKIGKKIIKIPSGITVSMNDGLLCIKNAKNEAIIKVLDNIKVILDKDELRFELTKDFKQARSNWGTIRALTQNAIDGLVKNFEKILILEGVGYRVIKEGDGLTLTLGFSHPVKYLPPKGINLEVEKNSILKIIGSDKALVGQVAAKIRSFKKPEPYKGKGFHYSNEVLRRKAGKKSAATSSV